MAGDKHHSHPHHHQHEDHCEYDKKFHELKQREIKEQERRHHEYLAKHPAGKRESRSASPPQCAQSDDGLPKKNKYEGRTRTLVQLIRMPGSGDLYAIPHKTVKSGYKSPNSYAFQPVFQDETTNSFFQGQVRKIGEESDSANKKLCPYYPNAPRNRKPEVMHSHVGTSTCDCRNASYISLSDGNPKNFKTPKTTNQLYMNYKCELVGMSNKAIAAERTRRMHRTQIEG